MTKEVKAKLFDDLMSWIDISAAYGNDPEEAKEALDSMLKYTLGVRGACNKDQILLGRDTEFEEADGTYDNLVRGLICPIQDECWYYGFKNANTIINEKNTNEED